MPDHAPADGAVAGIDLVLRRIDPDNPSDVRTITGMHLELLSWGPLARLGRAFLEQYCYTLLVRDGLMQVWLYEVQGQPAGFIAYTCCSASQFLREALRRHPARLLRLVFTTLALRPRSVRTLMNSTATLRYRTEKGSQLPSADAEILAIGVYPQYRSPAFVARTGLHIGRELFLHVVRELRLQGQDAVQADVDGFNREALLFYHTLGGTFHRFCRNGELAYRVLVELREAGGQNS